MSILWSCPSCNKTVEVRQSESKRWKVVCKCGVQGPWAETELEAIKSWNKMSQNVQLARS